MKITSVKEIELNEFFDPRRSFDGGGYHQPEYTISFDDGGELLIQDTSCGAFGDRIYIEYVASNGVMKRAAYGSMGIDEYTGYVHFTHFDSSDSELIGLIADKLGYHIPIKEE